MIRSVGTMLVRETSYATEGSDHMPAASIKAGHALKQPEGSILADVVVELQATDVALSPDQLAQVGQMADAIIGSVFQCTNCPGKQRGLCSGLTQDIPHTDADNTLHMFGGEADCSPDLTEADALCMRPDAYPKEINLPLPVSSTPQT